MLRLIEMNLVKGGIYKLNNVNWVFRRYNELNNLYQFSMDKSSLYDDNVTSTVFATPTMDLTPEEIINLVDTGDITYTGMTIWDRQ